MKKIKFSYLLSLLAFVLSSGLFITSPPSDQQITPIESKRMGEIIKKKLENEEIDNVAASLSDLEFWSTIISTDNLAEIVYQPANFRGDFINDDNISFNKFSPEFQAAKAQVLSLIQANSKSKGSVEIIYQGDEDDEGDDLPILVVKIPSYESLVALRSSKNVFSVSLGGLTTEAQSENIKNGRGLPSGKNKSFLDGLGFSADDRNGGGSDGGAENRGWGEWFGCANNEASIVNLLPDANGTVRVPWHYDEMGILEANECTAGAGVKITLLDTGLSQGQPNLSNSGFKATYPSRTISRTSTVSGGVWDNCGHGTLMAGVLAGPKRNSAVRGVAYESNLVSIRSNKDVLLISWIEKYRLKQALKKIRKGQSGTSGTKVVSMSLGYLFYSGMVAHQLKKVDKKGILMFGAIGTSNFGYILRKKQIYPAKSKRVSGVTGVFSGYPGVKKVCDKCHYGNKVDFVVPMQMNNPNGSSSILTHSLMMSGYDPAKVGGSSIATATMAGVAAMVWALPQNQNKDGDEIKDILIAASSHPNNKHSKFGHGVVDVLQATGCNPNPPSDPCEGVTCPSGYRCVQGDCVQMPGDECGDFLPCPIGFKCINGNCIEL